MSKVSLNQSWLDLSIKEGGNLEDAFELAKANGASLTDKPETGTSYSLTELPQEDRYTKTYLESLGVNPGTVGDPDLQSGIGFWIIGETFEVQENG